MKKHLFCLDIDAIQDYIFNTNRMKTIAGASSIIDRLNNDKTIKQLKNYGFGDSPEDSPKNADDFIYSNGGNTKILFSDRDKAEQFGREMHRMYADHGISVTTHIQEVLPSEKETLEAAERAIARKKYNKQTTSMPVTSPYLKVCENCGQEYAQRDQKIIHEDQTQTLLICAICERKTKENIRQFRGLPDLKFEQNLTEIKGKENMLALVVMDGNAMGEKIRKLPEDGRFRHLKAFSDTVDAIIHETLYDLITDIDEYVSDEKITFIRPIIVAGDDVCFIMKAEYGLDFTADMIEEIRLRTWENPLFDGGIEMSAGIVFMKHNFPFNIGRQIAESLLKSAKKKSVEHHGAAMTDFHIMHAASADHIAAIRTNEYTETLAGETYHLTQKPYSLDDMERYKWRLDGLRRCLAGNKLKSLREIIRLGKGTGFLLEMLRMASKMKPEDSHFFFKHFIDIEATWKKIDKGYSSDLLDLVEMADLLKGR